MSKLIIVKNHEMFCEIYDSLVAKRVDPSAEHETKYESIDCYVDDPLSLFVKYTKNPKLAPFGLCLHLAKCFCRILGFYADKITPIINYLYLNAFLVPCLGIVLYLLVFAWPQLFIPFIVFASIQLLLKRELVVLHDAILLEAYSDEKYFHELIDEGELVVSTRIKKSALKDM